MEKFTKWFTDLYGNANSYNIQNRLKMNSSVEWLTTTNYKAYYKVRGIKIVWYWHKEWQIGK